jgi:hypothetical protein
MWEVDADELGAFAFERVERFERGSSDVVCDSGPL